MAAIPLGTSGVTDYIQSGFLHLAAAGSNGSDNSAHGNHLRWQLLGNLGKKHLPKGTLSNSGTYATTIAYNRNNDYVKLYRAIYQIDQYRTAVNMFSTNPTTIVSSGDTREWQFAGIVPVAAAPSNTNTIVVRFADVGQYDYWAGIYSPTSARENFLKNYSGIIEAWVVGKVCFSAWISPNVINSSLAAVVRSEAIAIPDTTDTANKILCCRKTETSTAATQVALRGENIEYIRFSYSNLHPKTLSFQCYKDYMLGINSASKDGNWTEVGDYSLSVTDTVTSDRLEKTSNYVIDQTWPRYHGSNPTTGNYTVSVANYLDKWNPAGSALGVKDAVMAYLDKSKTDVFALDSLDSDTAGDQAEYDISYLETLKLIALDFHFARMLGLGCIDVPSSSSTYVYAATFKCTKNPADETVSQNTLNVFMSLPVNESTHRMPVDPYLKPITYGLAINNATSTPSQLADVNGYALYDDIRFINLEKELYPYDRAPGIFYESATDFCMADVSRPVLFGVKYKLGSEDNWRDPEISNDSDYQDEDDNNEVVPFPESNGPFFTHLETEEGVHEYAIYGVNLFSRVSNLSGTRATDETDFPVRNTLLPPSNFQVQLIQPESPPLLTTSDEQDPLLSGIAGTDKTLVRATFEWNEVHNIAYHEADKVDFYFCDHAPLTVRGVITTVTNATDNRAEVTLGSLTITSTNPPETVQPTISSGSVARFVGSQLAAGQQLYEVESVLTSGSSPVLQIKKIKQTQSQEYPIGSNQFTTTEHFSAPGIGDIVMLVENMSNAANWSTHLAKQVSIIPFTPLHTETVTMADGSQETLNYGGLYASADIVEELDTPSPAHTGIYTITFSSYTLPTITDSGVSWYKGSVRIASELSPSVIKKLEVWNIQDQGGDLILTVFDPAFQTDPIIDPDNYVRNGVNVNFHPGYKVYLYKDNTSGNNFTASAILPVTGEGSRITYMSIRSMDTTLTPDLTSSLSVPVPLLAREIVTPVAPTALNGPQYATRPNVYGKSTYTFDAELDTTGGRVPFGLMFLRASDRIILGALYNSVTLTEVLEDLVQLTGDDADNYEQRILDLINGEINTTSGTFKAYGTGTYVLPDPDNADLAIPDPNSVQLNDPLITPFDGNTSLADLVTNGILQAAVAHVFQPLTEQPVVYRYLKSGTKTSSKKPLFRDENGEMIPPVLPTDPGYDPDEYDPFPMAVTYTDSGDKFVRFTDYTLDGAATNVYFYYAIEFSNTNTFSPRSPILGAIRLVNTLPPDAPQIRKVTTQLADASLSLETAVLFEVNSYLPVDGIGEYRIYRAINVHDASNVRSMTLAATIEAGDPLIDDFSDVTYPLYGEVLYYRIVAVRVTKDENGNELKVPSQPSNIAVTNVVDVVNPPAPKMRSVNGTTISTELQEVILKWEPTAYNATYKLQKQNAGGNWVEIYSLRSNASMQYPPLDLSYQPDFSNYPATELLERVDADGNPVYHKFRVQVTNSSGLLNLTEKELTLAKGCTDLQELDVVVNYTDSNHSIDLLSSLEVDEGVRNPLVMQFSNLLTELPAGHNTLTQIDVTVTDGLSGSSTKTITPSTPTVTFYNGNGGLVLNTSTPNLTYTVRIVIQTDNCTAGAVKLYTIKYISSPCHDLLQLNELVSLTDDTHTIPVLTEMDINDGVAYPVTLAFTDISDPGSLSQVFNGMDITVTDDFYNTHTLSIDENDPGGTVTFNHGDGGLVLNGSDPNRTYSVEVKLYTDLCTAGNVYTYQIAYTYTPCEQLTSLTDIVSFADDNGSAFNPFSSQQISGTHHAGGSMTFGEIISSALPSGHSFTGIDIALEDGLGGYCLKSIDSPSGSCTFDHNDGGLVLDNSVLNLRYTVTLVLYTDLCEGGTLFSYEIRYLA